MITPKNLLKYSFNFLIILTTIVFIILSSIAIYNKYSEQGEWEAIISVFSLLGVLLTAGAGFVTIAAVVSYISINDKLKEAQKNLDEASEINQYKVKLKGDITELEKYQVLIKEFENENNKAERNINILKKYANNIIESKSDFQYKILAYAILKDIEADEAYEYAKIHRKKEDWERAEKLNSQLVEHWRILYLYDKKFTENYLASCFKQSVSLERLFIDNKNITYTIKSFYFNKVKELYVIILNEYIQNKTKNQTIIKAINNLGLLFYKEGNEIYEKNKDKNEAIHLYSKSIEILKIIKSIDNKIFEPNYTWAMSLHKLGKLKMEDNSSYTEVLKIWNDSKNKYYECLEIKPNFIQGLNKLITLLLEVILFALKNNKIENIQELLEEAKNIFIKNNELINKDINTAYKAAHFYLKIVTKIQEHDKLSKEINTIELLKKSTDYFEQTIVLKDFYKQINKEREAKVYNEYSWTLNLLAKEYFNNTSNINESIKIWDKAIKNSEKSIETDPKSYNSFDSLGMIYSCKANAIFENDSNNLPTARIYWGKAYFYFKEAIKIKKDFLPSCKEWKNSLIQESEALKNNHKELKLLWQNAKTMMSDFSDTPSEPLKELITFIEDKITYLH